MRIEIDARNVALALLASLATACGGDILAGDVDGGTKGGPTPDGGVVAPEKAGSADDGFDGGLIGPTPGSIRCGDVDCNASTEDCCLSSSATPATNGCAPRGQSLCNGTQIRRECDEQADCHPDEYCCAENVSGPPASIGMYCVNPKLNGYPPGCGLGEVPACSSDADCDAIGFPSCVAQTCRGNVLQTCGLLPSEWCD